MKKLFLTLLVAGLSLASMASPQPPRSNPWDSRTPRPACDSLSVEFLPGEGYLLTFTVEDTGYWDVYCIEPNGTYHQWVEWGMATGQICTVQFFLPVTEEGLRFGVYCYTAPEWNFGMPLRPTSPAPYPYTAH